jgi:hypothetical protein
MVMRRRPVKAVRAAPAQREYPHLASLVHIFYPLPGEFRVGGDQHIRDKKNVPSDRNSAQHLVFQHCRRECRRREVGDTAGDGVADGFLHSLGEIVIIEPHDDPQILGQRTGVQCSLQIRDITVGDGDKRLAAGNPRGTQRLLAMRVPTLP